MPHVPGRCGWDSREDLVSTAEIVEDAFREHGWVVCLNNSERVRCNSRFHIPATLAQHPLLDRTPPVPLCVAAGEYPVEKPWQYKPIGVIPRGFYDGNGGADGWCVYCLNVLLDQPADQGAHIFTTMDMTGLPDGTPVYEANGGATVKIVHTDRENCPRLARSDDVTRHESIKEVDTRNVTRLCRWCANNGQNAPGVGAE